MTSKAFQDSSRTGEPVNQIDLSAMSFELSQSFYFEAAHSLNRDMETESSRRIHGHTYVAQVTVSARPDLTTGMVMDLGVIRTSVERVRSMLDHRFLDEVEDLGAPTIENLCVFLWREFSADLRGLLSVRVGREASGDGCVLRHVEGEQAGRVMRISPRTLTVTDSSARPG